MALCSTVLYIGWSLVLVDSGYHCIASVVFFGRMIDMYIMKTQDRYPQCFLSNLVHVLHRQVS